MTRYPYLFPFLKNACLQWYGQNMPYLQKKVAGVSLEPQRGKGPIYLVTPTKDKLVPEASARGILSLFPQADVLAPMTGHVGLFGSRRAVEIFWKPYTAWLKSLD